MGETAAPAVRCCPCTGEHRDEGQANPSAAPKIRTDVVGVGGRDDCNRHGASAISADYAGHHPDRSRDRDGEPVGDLKRQQDGGAPGSHRGQLEHGHGRRRLRERRVSASPVPCRALGRNRRWRTSRQLDVRNVHRMGGPEWQSTVGPGRVASGVCHQAGPQRGLSGTGEWFDGVQRGA